MAARRKRKLSFLPQPPAAEPAIGYDSFPLEIGVGELLRLGRERQGQELQSVANQLRIRLAYLQAIEDGRFRDLPGSTYAVGFVRSYAEYLGLDSGDVVRRFREEVAKIHGRTKLVFPAVSAEGKIPGAAVVLLSVVGAAIVYGAWYYISSREDRDLQLIAEVPDRLVALPPGEGTTAASAAANGNEPGVSEVAVPPARGPIADDAVVTALANEAAEVSPTAEGIAMAGETNAERRSGAPKPAQAASEPTSQDQAMPGRSAPEQAASDLVTGTAPLTTGGPDGQPRASLATVPGPSAAVGGEPVGTANTSTATSGAIPVAPRVPIEMSSPLQEAMLPASAEPGIVLEARMDSWIEIVDADGKSLVSRVLRAGDRYVVPDAPGLLLTTGNAGGLDILVDGRKAPRLGDVGAVRRGIPLEAAQLRQGAAATD